MDASTLSSLELHLLVAATGAKREALLKEISLSENLTTVVGFFQP